MATTESLEQDTRDGAAIYRRLQLPLERLVDVAAPHYLDLLKTHRANIQKCSAAGDQPGVRREQAGAGRAAARLRGLLRELEQLRATLPSEYTVKFDERTRYVRDTSLAAVMDYLVMISTACTGLAISTGTKGSVPLSTPRTSSPQPSVAGSATSTDSIGLLPQEQDTVQLECSLADREASLRSWSSLQREVSGVHELLTVLHDAASTQQAAVLTASENVLQADCNVAEGRSTLAASERMSRWWVPVTGVMVGGLVLGPAGALLAGVKTAVGGVLLGGALGYKLTKTP